MDKSKYEQCSHGIIQDLPICAVQLGDSSQSEAQGHIFNEIVMSAGVEEKSVGLVVGGGLRGVDKTVAHVFFGFDSAVDDAIG